MYDLLKTLVAHLAMPLSVTLILLALGWLLAWRGARRLCLGLGLGVAALGLLMLFLASWAPVADRLLTPLEAHYPAMQALPDDQPLAGIVVLAGGWVSGVPWSSTGKLVAFPTGCPRLANCTRPSARCTSGWGSWRSGSNSEG